MNHVPHNFTQCLIEIQLKMFIVQKIPSRAHLSDALVSLVVAEVAAADFEGVIGSSFTCICSFLGTFGPGMTSASSNSLQNMISSV